MSRIVHMCLSVRGALKWPKRRLARVLKDTETGRWLNADDAREWLLDHLSQGHEVVPMCQCPGFDFKDGCQGNSVEAR